MVSNEGLRFDLRVVPPESYGNLLQHFTGSKQHNVALREEAVRRKLSISEYGIQNTETNEVFTDKTEEAMYKRLGYPWIPPELRENMGELQAAREGRLPQLVELVEIRGDLHTHSTWSSDGKNTIEEMVRRCRRARVHLHGDHRPLALPARGAAGGAEPGDRQAGTRSSAASSS